MKTTDRFEWGEMRAMKDGKSECFFIIAERSGGKWEFFERSTWNILWVQIPATFNLILEAEKRKTKKTLQKNTRHAEDEWCHPYPPPKRRKRIQAIRKTLWH